MPNELIESVKKNFAGKKILILGFGREGQSTAKMLHAAFPEARFAVMDKAAVDLSAFPYLDRQDAYLAGLGGYDAVFKTAGLPASEPAVAEYARAGGKLTSQLNEFLRAYAPRTIGVTGTKGKSTTSALICDMLKANGADAIHGGNIGIPPFDLAERIGPDTTVVLEMSSYQLETVELSPHIGVCLNIFPEHLDYHGSFDGYASAKANITKRQAPSDLFFYDGSFPALTAAAAKTSAWAINFASAAEINAIEAFSTDLDRLPQTVGEKNAPAAIAVARRLGVSDKAISETLRAFRPLPHRLEKVGEFRKVVFYDDTLATVPEATAAAIDSLPKIDVIIAGGFDRGIDYGLVAHKILAARIPHAIFFPTTGEKIAGLIRAQSKPEELPTIDQAESMEAAVRRCYELLPHGGVVLLSPAAPSFGLFKDYEDKSAQYVRWIKELGAA